MAPNWGLFSVWDSGQLQRVSECSLRSQMKREPASRYASYDQLWFSR